MLIENLELGSDLLYKKDGLPDIHIGDTLKVVIYLELPEEAASEDKKKKKERTQNFEGVVISRHNKKNQTNSTITVRKMFQGGGIEKVFVLNSPWIKEIKIMSRARVKRSKLYYLRERTGKSARLKPRF